MTPFFSRTARLRWVWRACAASLLVASVAWAARTVYVTTRYASLRSGTASTNPVIEKLSIGQALDVIGESGAFLQVKLANGKTGYIARSWTADSKPSGDGLSASLGQAARSSTSGSVSYTAGARGLSSEAQTYATSMGLNDAAEAVKKMEKTHVDDAAVEAFLKEGKLADWREVGP
jgi:N-acetylmuramoyl-L-alanine amidase